MLGNLHARFGGGCLEKYRLDRQLAGHLPYPDRTLEDGKAIYEAKQDRFLRLVGTCDVGVMLQVECTVRQENES